jgi:hypothetical protein
MSDQPAVVVQAAHGEWHAFEDLAEAQEFVERAFENADPDRPVGTAPCLAYRVESWTWHPAKSATTGKEVA